MTEQTHPIAQQILDRYHGRTGQSRHLNGRAKDSLPGGETRTSTFFRPYPAYMVKGDGCRMWDADGNEYLDFLNNYTSLIHGHAHPEVIEAVQRQMELGSVFGAPGQGIFEHAEHLIERIPAMDMVRYCNSGTEATMFALRAARLVTGRDGVIKMDGGYHGTHDVAEVNIKPSAEQPPRPKLEPGAPRSVLTDVRVVAFNDLKAVESILKAEADKIAAILVEPMPGAGGSIPPQHGYLAGLRHLADRYEVLLIFDEVMTFRLGYGGLQEKEGVKPDLTALAKIIGGGLPVGAFGGRAKYMDRFNPDHPQAANHAGTFNGNNLTMAAGLAALKLYDREAVDRLNLLGERLAQGLTEAFAQAGIKGTVTGAGSLLTLHWGAEPPVRPSITFMPGSPGADLPGLLHLELMNRGIFIAPRGMFVPSTPMTEAEIDRAAGETAEALKLMRPLVADLAPELVV